MDGLVPPLRALEHMGDAGQLSGAAAELETVAREFARTKAYTCIFNKLPPSCTIRRNRRFLH